MSALRNRFWSFFAARSLTTQLTFIILAGLIAATLVVLAVGVPIVRGLSELASDTRQLEIVSESRLQLAELYKLRRSVVEVQMRDCRDREQLPWCTLQIAGEKIKFQSVSPKDYPDFEGDFTWTQENQLLVKDGKSILKADFSWMPVQPLANEIANWLSTREHLGLVGNDLTKSLSLTLVGAALLGASLCLVLMWVFSLRMRHQYGALSGYIKTLATGETREIPTVLQAAGDLSTLAIDVHRLSVDLASAKVQALEAERMNVWQTTARKVAHEIKNPLTPISLVGEQVGVVAAQIPDVKLSQLLKESSRIIQEEIQSLNRMVKDFTAFARLSKPNMTTQNLDSIVRDFVTRNQTADGAILQMKSTTHEAFVSIDAAMMHQILHNLVNNARLAKTSGRVTVSFCLLDTESHWHLDIQDDGPGVPESMQSKMFDAYVTSRSTGDREKGMGLGLTISRQIAVDHGGHLVLAHTDSSGTTMRLSLPKHPISKG